MNYLTSHPFIDTIVVIIANLINIGMITIFWARTRHNFQLEHRIGGAQLTLIVPLLVVTVFNSVDSREWWTIVLPLLMVSFLLVELLLDYVLKLNFRQTRLLGPYLLLYYLALMGMIGYAFLTSEVLGFITLATYFIQLAATAYSYRKVGHGTGHALEGENR